MNNNKVDIMEEIYSLQQKLEQLENSRERSLAITKLEECELWLARLFNLV